MSPLAWIVAALVGGLACVGAGWRLGIDHEKSKQLDIKDAIQQTRDAAQQGAADAIVKATTEKTTVVTRVKTVTREVPVYRSAECQHDDRVFVDLNDALRGEPVGSGVVSGGSGDAAGQKLRGDDGKAQ